jgi:drug/metabolite transporter (DMT)-like permease
MTNMENDIVERADFCARRRALLVGLNAFTFGGVSILNWPRFTTPDGTVALTAWYILATVVFLLVVTGGALLGDRRLRALMNDEVSKANRHVAVFVGFCVTLAVAAIAVALPQASLSARTAGYCVVSTGLFVTLLTWAWLELRSWRQV